MQAKQSTAGQGLKPGRPRDQSTHRAILRAANHVLHEAGYTGFTIEGVAARAKVAKTSIYRRWASKGALLLDLYMENMSHEALKASGREIRHDFATYLSQTVERLKDPGWANTLRSLVAEAQTDPDLKKLVLEKVIEPRRRDGRKLLAEGIRTGEIKKDTDVETTLDFVFGAVWYRLLLGHAPVDEQFARQAISELFRRIGSKS